MDRRPVTAWRGHVMSAFTVRYDTVDLCAVQMSYREAVARAAPTVWYFTDVRRPATCPAISFRAGALAFRNDVPDAEIDLFDTALFALETDGSQAGLPLHRDLFSAGHRPSISPVVWRSSSSLQPTTRQHRRAAACDGAQGTATSFSGIMRKSRASAQVSLAPV
jgi:hypothetical protein